MATQITFEADYPGYGVGIVAAFAHEEAVRLVNSKVEVNGVEQPLAHFSTPEEAKSAAAPAEPPKEELSRMVRFLRAKGPYQPGNTATFAAGLAAKLVGDQDAVYHGSEEPVVYDFPRSTFNARAAVLRSLPAMKDDELRAAHRRFVGSDPGKKKDPEIRKMIRDALEPRTGGPVRSPKTGETRPAVTK